MDSDEDFKHYSSCYYDDDIDRAFYPENAYHQHQLDTKSWFNSDKIALVAHQQPQYPLKQLMIDNTVTSSDKACSKKTTERWNNSTQLPKDLMCDVKANTVRSVSINLHFYILIFNKLPVPISNIGRVN